MIDLNIDTSRLYFLTIWILFIALQMTTSIRLVSRSWATRVAPALLSRAMSTTSSNIAGLAKPPLQISSLHEIVDQYDIFLLDQFGVLHNGKHPLPGVVEALEYLQSKGKRTAVLSNTSSKSSSAMKRYSQLGLPPHYSTFLTSGELTWNHLHRHFHGQKCTWFTWLRYAQDPYLSSLDITCADIHESDFIFLHGTQCMVTSLQDPSDNVTLSRPPMTELSFMYDGEICATIDEVLTVGMKRGLPLVCGNIDDVAMLGKSQKGYMPGLIMKEYQRRGGHVVSFGKPQRDIFFTAMDLALNPDKKIHEVNVEDWLHEATLEQKSRILHVGDSLHHDIAGACAAGIDSLLITNHGVHSVHLHPENTAYPNLTEELLALCRQEEALPPTYFMHSFAL